MWADIWIMALWVWIFKDLAVLSCQQCDLRLVGSWLVHFTWHPQAHVFCKHLEMFRWGWSVLCISVCMYVCVYVYIHTYIHTRSLYICMHVYIHIYFCKNRQERPKVLIIRLCEHIYMHVLIPCLSLCNWTEQTKPAALQAPKGMLTCGKLIL